MRIRRVIPWLCALLVVCSVRLQRTVSDVVSGFSRTVLAQQRTYENGPFETIQIRPNVYVIFGAGANVTVHVGEDGVILVDTGSAATAGKVLEAVKAITASPIRLIINTSAYPEHVGGNAIVVQPDGRSIPIPSPTTRTRPSYRTKTCCCA